LAAIKSDFVKEDNGNGTASSLEKGYENKLLAEESIIESEMDIESESKVIIEAENNDQDAESEDLDEKIDFVIGGDDYEEEFGNLGFLPDDDDKQIDPMEGVEEVFHLSEEETATKLELAYAYKKMGDLEGAVEILREVVQEGNTDQIKEAKDLIDFFEKSNI